MIVVDNWIPKKKKIKKTMISIALGAKNEFRIARKKMAKPTHCIIGLWFDSVEG